MIFRQFFQFLVVFTLFLGGFWSAPALSADPVEGLWLTQNERSVIEIKTCEEGICGEIYWITEGGMQKDEHNPDEAKRDRPMCGLKILWDFEKDDDEWTSGNIYKADDGDMYSAKVKLLEDGTLKVRGYVGAPFLGKTQIWTRVSAQDYKQCS